MCRPTRVAAGIVALVLATSAAALPAHAQEAPAETVPTEAPPAEGTGSAEETPAEGEQSEEPPPGTTTVGEGEIVYEPPDGDAEVGTGDPTAGEPAVDPGSLLPDPTPGLIHALGRVDVAERARLAAEVAAAIGEREAATDRRAAVVRHHIELGTARDLARGAMRLAESRLRTLVVSSYVHHGQQSSGELTIDHDLVLDGLAADAMSKAVGEAADRELRASRVRLFWSEVFVEVADAEVAQAGEAVQVAAAEVDARHAEVALLPPPPVAIGPEILAPSFLTADDLEAWYRSWYGGDPPVAPIRDVAQAYLDVGAAEGVSGDIAFAQAILETGGFRSRLARGFNFAGIGAYSECSPGCGLRFGTLERGVAAHIQLLRAYADDSLTTPMLATAPDPRIAPERVGVRGCCPYWIALTGVWASDPYYDRKVLGLYRGMVEEGLRRRAQASAQRQEAVPESVNVPPAGTNSQS